MLSILRPVNKIAMEVLDDQTVEIVVSTEIGSAPLVIRGIDVDSLQVCAERISFVANNLSLVLIVHSPESIGPGN